MSEPSFTSSLQRPSLAESRFLEDRRDGTLGWRRLLFPAVFLVVLSQTVTGVHQFSSGPAVVVGYLLVVAFCVVYLCDLVACWSPDALPFWALFAALVALWGLEMVFARNDASPMSIFIAVMAVARLRARAVPVVAVTALVAVVVPALVPFWHQGLDTGAAETIVIISLAMFSFFALVRANHDLTEARSEVVRLAAENERTRIARDLHDLLGHSLTTITVKAGLARRLAATDPERSVAEIAAVEELSRQSLADVRAVVSNYREVTLASELAAGRELLRAAGIEAQLPRATDTVARSHQALFGWVVREGLTNVVRHAHATQCCVTIGPHSLDIVDNGVGGDASAGRGPAGSGLSGLRERVQAAGGTIDAGSVPPAGWRLHVEFPADGAATPADVPA